MLHQVEGGVLHQIEGWKGGMMGQCLVNYSPVTSLYNCIRQKLSISSLHVPRMLID